MQNSSTGNLPLATRGTSATNGRLPLATGNQNRAPNQSLLLSSLDGEIAAALSRMSDVQKSHILPLLTDAALLNDVLSAVRLSDHEGTNCQSHIKVLQFRITRPYTKSGELLLSVIVLVDVFLDSDKKPLVKSHLDEGNNVLCIDLGAPKEHFLQDSLIQPPVDSDEAHAHLDASRAFVEGVTIDANGVGWYPTQPILLPHPCQSLESVDVAEDSRSLICHLKCVEKGKKKKAVEIDDDQGKKCKLAEDSSSEEEASLEGNNVSNSTNILEV